MIQTILLIVGFVLLYKGADWLVHGASSLASRLRVSDFVVGLTVVALGTSIPELFVSIIGSIQGTSQIVVGNIIGSNVINIFVILGIASLLMPLVVTKGTVWKEIPFTLLATLILGFLANDTFLNHSKQSMLSRVDGFVLLLFFAAFMYYAFSIARKRDIVTESVKAHAYAVWVSIIAVVGGLAALFIGAKWVIDGAIYLARSLGVSETFIGLTVVAGGTSLPELATSVVAAYKKNAEIAVGNIVGSNIFNICLVLGISSLIRPIPFQPKANVDIGMALLGCIFLFIFMFTGKKHKLDRWEGLLFLVIYGGYLAFLIMNA